MTDKELRALRDFYAGVRARVVREQYGLDIWKLVCRHRNLPQPEFLRVRAEIAALPIAEN